MLVPARLTHTYRGDPVSNETVLKLLYIILFWHYCQTIVKLSWNNWDTIVILFILMFNYSSDPFNFDTSGLFTPMYHWSSGPVTTCDHWPVNIAWSGSFSMHWSKGETNQCISFVLKKIIGIVPYWSILAHCKEFQNYNLMESEINVCVVWSWWWSHQNNYFLWNSFETETESHNAITMIIKQLETHVVTYFLVSPSLSRLENIIHHHCPNLIFVLFWHRHHFSAQNFTP